MSKGEGVTHSYMMLLRCFGNRWIERYKNTTSTVTSDITSAVHDIIHHVALLVNGVAVRFKAVRGTGYVIDVLLAGIYIAKVLVVSLVCG